MQFLDERLPERFWRLCVPEPNTGCWLWIGGTNIKGYGRFGTPTGMVSTHRLTYATLVAPLADDLHIDHRVCKTPACCNPTHLEAVAPIENWRRGNAPSAIAIREARCAQGHEYTPENTKLRYEGGVLKQRVCRTCRRQAHREYKARRRQRNAETRAA